MGYETYGIAIGSFPIRSYPNFKFIRGDIIKTDFPSDFFDIIIAVSTIEHIGLGGRYDASDDPYGDKKAIREMTRILKKGKEMLTTVPYGKRAIIKPWHRVYDRKSLNELFGHLTIIKEQYYKLNEKIFWISTSEWEAVAEQYALALLKLRK